MPGKSPAAAASVRSKKAGKLLEAAKAAEALAEQKKHMQAAMHKIAKERKKALRQASALKKKASKCDLGELMQIVVMKAAMLEDSSAAGSSSGSSSSSSNGAPLTPGDAVKKIQQALNLKEKPEVKKFAAELLAEAGKPDVEE
jgi:hypothetical protein